MLSVKHGWTVTSKVLIMIVIVGVLLSTFIVALISALVGLWQVRSYMKEQEDNHENWSCKYK